VVTIKISPWKSPTRPLHKTDSEGRAGDSGVGRFLRKGVMPLRLISNLAVIRFKQIRQKAL
jgi:hypothetical protein